MTLNIHSACRRQLIQRLSDGLSNVTVDNGISLDYDSCSRGFGDIDDIIPGHGDVRKKLVSYIDERPVFLFVFDRISVDLYDHRNGYVESRGVALCKFNGYEDLLKVSELLINQLDSLPWKYTVSVELPKEVSSEIVHIDGDCEIGNGRYIRCESPDFSRIFPYDSENKKKQERIHAPGILGAILGLSYSRGWTNEALYIQIEMEGYINRFGTTEPAREAIRSVRAFIGLGLALRLFDVNRSYVSTLPVHDYLIHKNNEGVWEVDNRVRLGAREAAILQDIIPFPFDKKGENPNGRASIFGYVVGRSRKMFAEDDVARRIFLASEWLFDSFFGDDECLRFVQTMVVLEILLGDKETSTEIGLGALLRNRCAYLIADNHEEREEIIEKFKEIYDVRSKIVHRGAKKLSSKEFGLLVYLQNLCRRVILKESSKLK